tara:strand:+ start:392 stop:1696 length:1305 start_codon:yes stop_codon:yes gene_type:complete
MSLYANNNVITNIIDPVYNRSKQRTVFELPNDTALLGNMRIGNFGISANTQTSYLSGIGALGAIDSIMLESQDGTVIDQVQNFQIYQSFKQYNRNNQRQKDRASNLSKNNQASMFNDVTDANEDGPKITDYDINDPSRYVATTEDATAKGWYGLDGCLNILKAMPIINTKILRNLRLVINYASTSDIGDYVINNTSLPFETTQPFLIVDELRDPPISGFQPVEFNSIEHDSVSVSSILPTAAEITKVQNVSVSLNGFRNKSIQRMLICKTPQLASSYTISAGVAMPYGKVASVACLKESLQISVNGSNLFTENGITSSNQRLAMLNDVYDVCSTYPFLNGMAYVEADATDRNASIKSGNSDISQLDFYGCLIQSEISDLKLNWTRTGVYVEKTTDSSVITPEASNNQALVLNCFAEVKKMIAPTSDGGFLVQYV